MSVTQISATDAFDTTLRDIIPSTIASPTLTSVADTAGVVTTNNFQITGNTLTTVTAFDVEKDPSGRTITLTIDGILQGPFTANQSITNTNTITGTIRCHHSIGSKRRMLYLHGYR